MSTDRGKELTDAHNKGEQDQRENEYEPPNSLTDFLYGKQFEQDRLEEKEAYDKGWENAKKSE